MNKEGIRGLDDAIFTGSVVNKEPLDQTVGLSIPFGFWTPQQQCCTQAPLIVLKCCVGRASGGRESRLAGLGPWGNVLLRD